jgi:hypothetical protein
MEINFYAEQRAASAPNIPQSLLEQIAVSLKFLHWFSCTECDDFQFGKSTKLHGAPEYRNITVMTSDITTLCFGFLKIVSHVI